MFKLLTDIRQFLGTCSDEYRIIRRRLFKVMGVILACSVFAVALNYWGFKTVNAIIGCILPFVALYMFTAPEVIGSVVLAGLVTSPRHPITGIKGVAELVGQALAWIVLVTSLFFLVVGTLPLGRNFSAVGVVYLCFIILLLMDVRNIKKTRFVTGLFYSYAIIALVVSLGSMIPGPVHIKLYGHDLFGWLRISPVENALARIEDAETEVSEKAITAALAAIEKKVREGQDLTTNDLFIKAYAKAERDKNTAPAKAKEAWRGIFPVKPAATTGPTMAAPSGRTFTITLRPNEKYEVDKVRQGQRWSFPTFTGEFQSRVDTGDDSACWETVKDTLPWKAEKSGSLQIKTGQAGATVTVNVQN